VQTSLGFLVTYYITFDQNSRVYQQIRIDDKAKRLSSVAKLPVEEARYGQREIHLRFRMVIKVDAGIGKAVALEDELIVATQKPAAVQCIRWNPDGTNNQTSTELLSRLPWIGKKSIVTEVVHDRAMSLFVWILTDGKAYAVQKISKESQKVEGQGKYFKGYGFHHPRNESYMAVKAAINARFSLLAIGCKNGDIAVYSARDYAGSLPISHRLIPPASSSTTGAIKFLTWSPDGYCLFVGYENGWVTWSVYGKLCGNSFNSNTNISKENDEKWLLGTQNGSWVSGGSEIILTALNDDRIWVLEFAKSATTGCFGPANISRTLLHTATSLMIYNGHDAPDIMSLSAEDSVWTHVQIPTLFLINQRPIRCAVVSPDGRYVAIAGRRGLAHYSLHSGRWKTFDDLEVESSFVVRGGMCWHQHILIAAVDTGDHDEVSVCITKDRN
jgi:RAB6A-GEF complex partner protein 1